MTPERWERVKSVFQSALERTSAERHAFLGEACSGDQILQAEVESLLVSHQRAGSFIQEPLLPPPRRLVPGDCLGAYEVVRLLGSGGMGDVYLARDPRLERHVALKVLSSDMAADQERRARLLREARAVSALNHPNICTIHEIGCAAGQDYICFEHIQGQRLDALLADGGLSLERLLELGVPLADAIAYAHGKGILHRDLKPANIMVSELGIPKVLDFGLARILPLAEPAVPQPKTGHSEAGLLVGTAAYMSPEQALGRATDERSDVFSFGGVLYEMATGRPPFVGPTPMEVLDGVLHAEPESLARIRPDLPFELSIVVEKTLSKDPSKRYQHMWELAEDLRRLQGAISGTSRRVSASGRGPTMNRPSLKTSAFVAGVAVVAALVSFATSTVRGRPDATTGTIPAEDVTAGKTRVAVLPFENLTRQADDDWLASAFSDSLTLGLQSLDSLILVSRSGIAQAYSANSLREADRLDPEAIERLARALGVRYYVHGSYQRIGDQVRVVARLVEIGPGTIMAQESVTDRLANLLQLEDALAQKFAVSLQSAGALASRRPETTSLAAYRAITEGRGLYASARWQAALESSKRAVDLDPEYAEAWALLGKSYARIAAPSNFVGGPIQEYRSRALAAAQRAVELDPSSYQAHVALALAYRGTSQVEAWRAAARKAIALNPRFSEGYALLGDSYAETHVWGCGRARDTPLAVSYYRQALRIDPDMLTYYFILTNYLRIAGRAEEALQVADEGLRVYPSWRRSRGKVHALIALGRIDEAERILHKAIADDTLKVEDRINLAIIDLKRGHLEAAANGFRQGEAAAGKNSWSLIIGREYVEAGVPGPGLVHLESAFREEPACAQWLLTTESSWWGAIRANPQGRALLERYARR